MKKINLKVVIKKGLLLMLLAFLVMLMVHVPEHIHKLQSGQKLYLTERVYVTPVQMFLFGLLSSFHCIGMCGGLILTVKSSSSRAVRNMTTFHTGRLLAALATGAIAGVAGSALQLNIYMKKILPLLCGVYMLFKAIQMLGGLRGMSVRKGNSIIGRILSRCGSNPFLLGVFNLFLPCNMSYTAQIMTVNSNAGVAGGILMVAFVAGTIPLMFLFGTISDILDPKYRRFIEQATTWIIVYYAIRMIVSSVSMA